MITNIRNAFIEMLQNSTWMDNVSREKAIEKVNQADFPIDRFGFRQGFSN